MADRIPSKLTEQLNNFFNGRSSHIPRLCFSETNPDILESTYFIVALSQEIPKDILKLLSKSNFDLLSYQIENIDEQFISYLIVWNDNDGDPLKSLEKMLSSNKDIGSFKVKELTKLERNPFTYPVKPRSGLRRSILMDHDMFHAMFRTITSSLGSGGDYLMYMSGISVADHIWNNYGIGDQEEFDDQFQILEDVLRTFGFGMVSFENIDPLRSEGKVVIKHSLEETLSDSCPFLRGLLTEIIRRVFEDPNIELIETSCVNRGDDECIFELTRIKEI